MPDVIAHRGTSAYALENSLEAFRLAIEMEADGIELDVHATADGEFTVHHDPLIAGRPILEMAAAETRAHRLANDEPVPSLAEVLRVAGDRITLYIEIKSFDAPNDEALLSLLDSGPAPAHYHVHAFDHRVIRRLWERRPTLPCGVLSTSYPVRPLPQLSDAGATELWQEHGMIDHDLVAQARGAGYRVVAWTVDDPGRMAELAGIGVDAICTNRPDIARSALR